MTGGLALSLSVAVWTLHLRHDAAPEIAKAPVGEASRVVAANPYGPMLVDLGYRSRSPSASTSAEPETSVSQNRSVIGAVIPQPQEVETPAATVSEFAGGAPLPPRRPAELRASASRSLLPASTRRLAQQIQSAAPQAVPSDNRSFFEKFFGVGEGAAPQSTGAKPSAPALAYAAPETGLSGGTRSASAVSPSPNYDRWTAVYDISAHTVHMPNGTKLEAHSGLGSRLDDPRYVHERMHGPTPPHVYSLSPREALFHGVEALRLTPIGAGDVFGRAGLLAHTYMLGPNGDSNGCVSFRNYDAFLRAYKNGEVKRLLVVAHL